jgi:hypothetical protein
MVRFFGSRRARPSWRALDAARGLTAAFAVRPRDAATWQQARLAGDCANASASRAAHRVGARTVARARK